MSDLSLQQFDFSKKFLYHPEQIEAYRKGERPFPINLEVDLTEICNHRCSFCNSWGYRESNEVTLEEKVIKPILKEAKEMGTKSISFTGGGEPMVHKDFLEILKYSKKVGLENGLLTNGSRINEKNVEDLRKNLEWARISIGGGNKETYKSIQGIDHFDRVIDNIKSLSSKKSEYNLKVGVRMLVLENNISSIEDLANTLKETNIDYLQLAPNEYSKDGGKFWNSPRTRQIFGKVKDIIQPIKFLGAGYNINQNESINYPEKCYAHFFQGTISGNGNFLFCKNSRGIEEYSLGNIKKSTLAEIWDSEKIKDLEKRIRPNNCGRFCKNSALNNGMQSILHPDSELDINFVN